MMADTLSYLWWQADTKREPYANTFAAALQAHEQRFGRAVTSALVPLGMAAQVGQLPSRIIVEERDTVPLGTVMVR
jgi:hypothetical protein